MSSRYKWTALSNTTLGAFMATLDSSIVIISLPAIFRGIQLDPLEPSNISYLLWMLMGYLVCTGLQGVPPDKAAEITGKTFFPELISEPFIDGLRIAFTFSLVLFLLAAAASWMRGAMPPGPLDDDVGEALEETVLA